MNVVTLPRAFATFLLGATVFLAAPAVAQDADWPRGATWSGSALGGAHYVFGTALMQVVQKTMGVNTTVEATGGPLQSVDLLGAGETDFIAVPSAQLYQAYTGTGDAEGNPTDTLRSVMPMFPQYMQFWSLPGVEIADFRDLAGKHVDMSGAGSFLNQYGRKLFEMFDVEPAQITNLTNFGDSNQMLGDGQIDASGAWSGLPAPAAAEMASTRQAKIFAVPAELGSLFAKEYPGVFTTEIPAGTYDGQTEAVETLGLWTMVATRSDLSEDFVYNVVKNAFENQAELQQMFAAAKDTLPENISFSPIPLHKGAYRYYNEMGIDVPEAAMPID